MKELNDQLRDEVAQLLADREAKAGMKIVEAVEKQKEVRERDIIVAERIGKEPTTRGPISQARIDGYAVATDDAIAAARQALKDF